MCTEKRDLDASEAVGLYPPENRHCELVLSLYPTAVSLARGTRALNQVSPTTRYRYPSAHAFLLCIRKLGQTPGKTQPLGFLSLLDTIPS